MHRMSLKIPVTALALSLGALSMGCQDDVGVVQLDPGIQIDPATVDFGNIQIGTTVERTVLIRNTGEANLEIQGVSRGAPFDDSYTFSVDRMIVVPNGVAALKITFSPEETGEKNAVLIVRPTSDKLTPQEVAITGIGATTTLEVDPRSLSFGNVVVDSTANQPIRLTNNSELDANVLFTADQNVKLCTSGAADPSEYCVLLRDRNISAEGRFLLRAGESTTMEVQFTPTIAGQRVRGTFTLAACDSPACEIQVLLDGLGVESGFRCTPPSLDFGQVNPGSCLSRTVSCENIANTQVTILTWGPATIGGRETSADFDIEAAQVQVLSQGDSVSVDVTYCPEDLGNDAGFLQIETDNRDARLRFVNVELSGTGGGPDIEVLPLQVNFGLVSLIAPSRRTVLVTNVGFAPLEVTEILVDTDGTGAFIAPGAAADVIGPGESMEITVEFQPLSEGPVESSMLIRSSDQDESEVEVRLIGEGINLPPCSFEVAPANLSFGVVERTRSVRRAFEIRNVGQNDCLVTSARLEPGSDPEFSLPEGDLHSLIIPPASATIIPVLFSPTASADFSGGVEFSISSPTQPFVTVALSGTGADATLLIVPNDLDFGTIGVGCAARARTVTVYNTGATAARIDSVVLASPANPAFTLTSLPSPLPAMPLNVAPGASFTFDVGFRADQQSAYAGAVEINGTFAGQPVTYIVALQGRGDVDATQVDTFDQLGRPKVDILFVIDNSCSMGDEQMALSANFAAFIQFAEAQALDYQLGVTSAEVITVAGRLVHVIPPPNASSIFAAPISNRIVTPNTQPSPQQVFVQNVTLGTFAPGSANDESGFRAGYLALTAPNVFGHNAGFLRTDAVLSIIFVSDEPEQSAQPVDFFINFFLSIKGFRNNNLFSASSIAGGPTGCSGAGGNASASPRYVDIAQRTGGVFQSICTSDWSRSLEDLSTAAFGFKSRFFLSNQPVISTIDVAIDGVGVPGTSPGGTVNWTYDFSTNSVNFSPFATPEPGAQIVVEYTAECL